MIFCTIKRWIMQRRRQFIQNVEQRFKVWTKPTRGRGLAIGVLTDLTRSKQELIAENALLRQQLIVLNRQIERAKLTQKDRWLLVLLARFTMSWKQALSIVQPDTLLKWHRQGFRLFWGRKTGCPVLVS